MIVARTAPHFYPRVTGPGKQAHQISAGLEKLGISSLIFTTTQSGTVGDQVVDITKVKVYRLPVSLSLMQFDISVSFPRALARERFDILHAHEYREYLGTMAFVLAKTRGIPFVL